MTTCRASVILRKWFEPRSAYHLKRISRGMFHTNETALFLSKEMDRMEPYHLILRVPSIDLILG